MAAENKITLDLVLNDKGALTSLEDLRMGVKVLTKELEGVEIGSEYYNRLRSSIGAANTEIKSQEKLLKGLTSEELGMAYARIGGGISSTFAAATAALQMFGIESEEVTKAAVKAQSLLTIAISTRQIQEGLLSAKLLANVVAQNAYNASVAAGNAVTKAFYATVAANPFGAILALIGVLVTAVIALNSAFSKGTDVVKNYNKAVAENQAQVEGEIVQIQSLTGIINDNTRSMADRQAALELLGKTVPGVTDLDLKQEGALERVNKATLLYIEVLKQRAKAEAALQIFQEATKKALEIQAKGLEDYSFNLVALFQKTFGGLGGQAAAVQTQLAAKNKELAAAMVEVEKAGSILNGVISEQNELEIQLTKNTNANTKSKEGNTKATNAQVIANKKLQSELKRLADFLKLEIDAYNDLGKAITVEDKLPALIERVNKAYEARIKLLNKTGNQFENQLRQVGILKDEWGFFADTLDDSFDIYGQFVEAELPNLIGKLGAFGDEYENESKRLLASIQSIFANPEVGLTPEALESFKSLLTNFDNLQEIVTRFPSLTGEGAPFAEGGLQTYLEILKKVKAANGEILYQYDATSGKIVKADADLANYADNVKKLNDFETKIAETTRDKFAKMFGDNLADFQKNLDVAYKNNEITLAQYEQLKAAIETESDLQLKKDDLIQQLTEGRIKAIQNLVNANISETDRIRAYFKQFQDEYQSAQENFGPSLIASIGKFTDDFNKISDYRVKKVQSDNEKIFEAEEALQAADIDISRLTAEEKLQIYEILWAKIREGNQKNLQDNIKNFQNILRVFQQGLNALNEAIRNNTQLTLEVLEMNYKRASESIIGDTAEANAKRVELEKEYQAQIAEVNKKARIKQLRLDQAQAVTNVALAVSRALAEGGALALITGGIVALAGAAQLSTIQQQINLAQSYKKGGIIKAQQGMLVSGPSHENGGVMFQSGGYNLEGGESIVSRNSTRMYSELLNSINMAGGGRPIVMSQFDDSRIVEAIAKQRANPIRAYVVEQDITNKQGLSKRLSQISKF